MKSVSVTKLAVEQSSNGNVEDGLEMLLDIVGESCQDMMSSELKLWPLGIRQADGLEQY